METIENDMLGKLIAEFKSIQDLCLIKVYAVTTDISVKKYRKILKHKKVKIIPSGIGLKIFRASSESDKILNENLNKLIFSIGYLSDDLAVTANAGNYFHGFGKCDIIHKGEMVIVFEEILNN